MKLVFVHGRGQQGNHDAALRAHWGAALDNGLRRARCAVPPHVTIDFPFYGDRLDRLLDEVKAPLALNIDARGPDGTPVAADLDSNDVRIGLLGEFAEGAGLDSDDIARESDDEWREMGLQNLSTVRATARALDRVPGLNARALDWITRDVYVYLEFKTARRVIDRIVADVLQGDEPVVMVAHSLGTVVAYNVLRARPEPGRVRRLVTLGSPLALGGMRRFLNPLVYPPPVAHWFNAYDRRDVVALRPLDDDHFSVGQPIENYSDVVNYTQNCHGIEGYLSDPVVASRIAEALSP
jgi:pimeloyl-ACP methyl ester carboxylesterase